MSAPSTFNPQHPQPFTLEQAMLLEVNMLVTEISRLQNSIAHLQRTQTELLHYLQDEEGEDNDGELGRAVRENEDVIASQTERIEMIKVALRKKVGDGAMRHYGFVPESGRPPDSGSRERQGSGTGASTRSTEVHEENDDAVYL